MEHYLISSFWTFSKWSAWNSLLLFLLLVFQTDEDDEEYLPSISTILSKLWFYKLTLLVSVRTSKIMIKDFLFVFKWNEIYTNINEYFDIIRRSRNNQPLLTIISHSV